MLIRIFNYKTNHNTNSSNGSVDKVSLYDFNPPETRYSIALSIPENFKEIKLASINSVINGVNQNDFLGVSISTYDTDAIIPQNFQLLRLGDIKSTIDTCRLYDFNAPSSYYNIVSYLPEDFGMIKTCYVEAAISSCAVL